LLGFCSRDQTEFLATRQTEYVEVAMVGGKDCIDSVAITKMNRQGVGKLYAEAAVLCQNRFDSWEIRFA
jgi:hypothetical protein